MAISYDGFMVRKMIFSGLFTRHVSDPKNLAEDQEVNDKGSNVVGIPVDDAGVMQVVHVIHHEFVHKNKLISFSLLSLGEEGSNVLRHYYSVSF